jgi:uncharacterized membrane protein YfcA
MDALDLGVLALAGLATSIVSAIVGMAGGITLLTVMLLFLEPLVAIPLHGVVQLVSNTSRSAIQRRHVEWGIVLHFSVLLLPMAFVGLLLARQLPPAATRTLIGIFVLVATWRPAWILLGTHPEQASPKLRFLTLGGVAGALSTTIGATGPLMAPFYLNLGLSRFGLVGTKAACQTLGHLAKIAVFGIAGFQYRAYWPLLAMLALVVLVGTWIGSRLLHRVNELWFTRLYKLVLTAIAAHLVLAEGLGAMLG